jgi:hypothetical protein
LSIFLLISLSLLKDITNLKRASSSKVSFLKYFEYFLIVFVSKFKSIHSSLSVTKAVCNKASSKLDILKSIKSICFTSTNFENLLNKLIFFPFSVHVIVLNIIS